MTDPNQHMDPATDPVCGMAVDANDARAQGLTASYQGRDYFFCGRGCLLDFADDPARFFADDYTPHMS